MIKSRVTGNNAGTCNVLIFLCVYLRIILCKGIISFPDLLPPSDLLAPDFSCQQSIDLAAKTYNYGKERLPH